jgi:uncharacterized protein YggU (UPF0235/DUF167 family)
MMGLQALKRPKSDVTIIRGLKSRDKTVAITGFDFEGDEEICVSRVRKQLYEAIEY